MGTGTDAGGRRPRTPSIRPIPCASALALAVHLNAEPHRSAIASPGDRLRADAEYLRAMVQAVMASASTPG